MKTAGSRNPQKRKWGQQKEEEEELRRRWEGLAAKEQTGGAWGEGRVQNAYGGANRLSLSYAIEEERRGVGA